MTAVLIVAAVMTVPLTAILSLTYLARQRIAARTKSDAVLERKVEHLLAENADMRERVENLEAIVTSVDWDALQLEAGPVASGPALQAGEEAS